MVAEPMRQWRDDICAELVAAERELVRARSRLTATEASAVAAAENRRRLREEIAQALLPEETIAGALARRLQELEPAHRDAGAAVTAARQAIENLEHRIGDLRAALSQLDRTLVSADNRIDRPLLRNEPELPSAPAEAEAGEDGIVMFPRRPAA